MSPRDNNRLTSENRDVSHKQRTQVQRQSLLKTGFLLLGLSLGAATHAMPPTDLQPSQQAGVAIGAKVNKLTLGADFPTWRALDERHLLLSQKSAGDFLVTLAHTCVTLPTATTLGVSASNQTIYAGFDYITADGEQCAIQTISRLTAKEVEAALTAT